MQDLILRFQDYLKTEKKSSKNTLESYMRDIGQFFTYCSANNIKSAESIKSETIMNYLKFVHSLGKSDSTIARVTASLRSFFTYLLNIGEVLENPVKTVKFTAATQKKLPEILTNKEVLTLLSQPDCSNYKGCRDKAMLELLYATGIKVSEIIDLKVTDINLQIGILHLHTESSQRIIPIYPDAVKTIANYLTGVRGVIVADSGEDKLFTNMSGQPLTRQGFWKIIKQYAEAAKINKDITPHTLRHSFAAHLLENGAELQDIKEMLGHSDISTTQVYAQLMKNKYAQSYRRFHPMAK
ncbi:MAG: tyrosine recombinase [Acutalibacteraceae bacterium]|nr:tyrosine recombinase [Acutalibacteraceae bacterium]